MMTPGDVRAIVSARLSRAREVQGRFAAFERDAEQGGATALRVTVRCDEPGHSRKMPKLAEFVLSPHGALFTSRIAYLPSDQLNLRPWMRDHLLGGGGENLMTADDEVIRNYLEHLDDWGEGQTPIVDRWLKSMPPTTIREVVDLLPLESRLGLWTRCKDHPAKAEAISPAALFAAARRG